MFTRRAMLAAAAGVVASRVTDSWAQPAFPSRPVTIVAPFTPGTPADVAARRVAQAMTGTLSQSVVVENRSKTEGRPLSFGSGGSGTTPSEHVPARPGAGRRRFQCGANPRFGLVDHRRRGERQTWIAPQAQQYGTLCRGSSARSESTPFSAIRVQQNSRCFARFRTIFATSLGFTNLSPSVWRMDMRRPRAMLPWSISTPRWASGTQWAASSPRTGIERPYTASIPG